MENDLVSNITRFLYEFAEAHPEKYVFLHPDPCTYKELILEVDRFGEGFRKSGIGQGTRTVVLIKPSVDLFAVTFALLRIGAIPVMIDPGMGRKRMTNSLAGVEAEAFVGIPTAHLLKYLYPKAFSSVKVWISTNFRWFWRGYTLRRMEYVTYHTEPFQVGWEDEAAIFYTSGSTGQPKGVIYNSRMLEAQIHILKNSFGYQPEEIDLCTFPLVALLMINQGISVVLADMDMVHPARLNPGKVIDNIREHSCTHMFCSPMVLKRLTAYGISHNITLDSLKKIMVAGAPVTPAVLRNFRRLITSQAEIHTPYGATEALPVSDICDKELLGYAHVTYV